MQRESYQSTDNSRFRGGYRGRARGRGRINTSQYRELPINVRALDLDTLLSLQHAIASEIIYRHERNTYHNYDREKNDEYDVIVEEDKYKKRAERFQSRTTPKPTYSTKATVNKLENALPSSGNETHPLPKPEHQDYADKYREKDKNSQSTTVTLFAKGIPGTVTAEALQSEFGKYTSSEVEVCLILTGDDQPTGTAYVLIRTPDDGEEENLIENGLADSEKPFSSIKVLHSRRQLLTKAELDEELETYAKEAEKEKEPVITKKTTRKSKKTEQ
jgi:hypothetical protein